MRNSLNRAMNILLITVFILGSTKTTYAIEKVNEDKKGSLTIEHKYKDTPLKNVDVDVYRVAKTSKNGDLIIDKNYKKYPIDIDNIKEYDKRDIMSQTLATYTKLDNIKEYASGSTDNKGYVKFSDLEKGVYLVIVEDKKLNNKTISTKPFLVYIPSIDPKTNTLVYDVKSQTKSDESDKNEQKDLSVKKIWENNNIINKPKVIVVELYKDNKLYDTVELSKENNWYHKWENLEKDCEYIIKEKSVPNNYYVTYEEYGNEVIITNSYTENPTDEPTDDPTDGPTDDPTDGPTDDKTDDPTDDKTDGPTDDKEDDSTDDKEDDSTDNKTQNEDYLDDNIIDNDDVVKDENYLSNKLPQTGALWWPVPVLLIAGMILFILGISKKDR